MALIPPNDPGFALALSLIQAARDQQVELVQTLLAMAVPADAVVYERFNAMGYAAEHGNVAIAQVLLDAGAPGFDPTMVRAEPALHRAITFERYDFARWLLDQPDPSFDPNRRNADGWTALHLLGVQGETALAQRLLDLGADPHLLTPVIVRPAHPDDEDQSPGANDEPARDAVTIARVHGHLALVAVFEGRTLNEHLDAGEGAPERPSHVRPRL